MITTKDTAQSVVLIGIIRITLTPSLGIEVARLIWSASPKSAFGRHCVCEIIQVGMESKWRCMREVCVMVAQELPMCNTMCS